MRFAKAIVLITVCGTFAAAEPAAIRAASHPQSIHPTQSFRAHFPDANACSPLGTIVVDRFKPVVTSMASEIEIAIHVDDHLIGTETLQLAEVPASPVQLEILRFQPQVRQQLISRADDGAVVDARSPSLTPEIVLLTPVHELLTASDLPTAQIVRSTWRASGAFKNVSRSEPAVRPIETELTRLLRASSGSCFSDCEDERLLCEEQRCDFSPCAGCDAWYDDCTDLCSCDGIDPVLVDEYNVTEVHVVSGPHSTVCAGNIFNFSNRAYYDEYIIFYRVKTYKVWEDCHGNRTTELASTSDSSNRWCYYYTGQICSSSPGTQPPCVF